MQKLGILFCFIFITSFAFAQGPAVPDKIRFAGMQLDLTTTAQKKIQADVDALRRSERYFRMKLERVDLYMPLIEKAFREENVPDDFKYLVIQESALIGDAVSSANAIGYWQFKVPAALEVGLTINNAVDERMNIVNASHGAAKYLKKNNTAFFDNWLYALLAYNTGPGGALKITDKSQYGAKRMKLDGRTHWYVLKFLAHKIAFENEISKDSNPHTELIAYAQGGGKTLGEIAAEFDLTEADLEPYNKWLKKKHVPTDKAYYVVLPLKTDAVHEELLASATKPNETEPEKISPSTARSTTKIESESHRFPEIEKHTSRKGTTILINGIPGTIALNGENLNKLAARTDVRAKKLQKYNDLDRKGARIAGGKPYYLKKKRNKAKTHYHVVEPGETLWSISQRFGMKQKKLMRNNRMKKAETVKPGRVLWLRFIRPRGYPVEYKELPKQEAKPVLAEQPSSGKAPVSRKQTPEVKPVATRVEPEEKPVAEPQPRAVREETPSGQNDTPKEVQASYEEEKAAPKEQPEKTKPTPDEEEFEVENDFAFTDSHQKGATSHTVQSGDTWYGIARHYEVSITDLTKANHMHVEDKLSIGQQLQIPSGARFASNHPEIEEKQAVKPGKATGHQVKPGETMYSISRHYGVTVKELMDWNQKETFDLNVGEELKVHVDQ